MLSVVSFAARKKDLLSVQISPSIQLAGDLEKLVGDFEKLSHSLASDAVVHAGINFDTVLSSFLFPFS